MMGGSWAAAIVWQNPKHRRWYFLRRERDEALLFKFHDSEKGVGAEGAAFQRFWMGGLRIPRGGRVLSAGRLFFSFRFSFFLKKEGIATV
jgi:hypothetical protein